MAIPKEMLRKQLKENDGDLYQALMRNWEVAEEWLSLIPLQGDSSNAYPHIRDVEHYLDTLVIDDSGNAQVQNLVQLSPIEIYVLLAATFFHDIGRAWKSQNKHGKESENFIREKFRNSGIPSAEIADSVGRLCGIHDDYQKLRTIVVDPYGEIRQGCLGALLFLADHMDNTFRRVSPRCICPADKTTTRGELRRHIRGVKYDPSANMVRTVIGDFEKSASDKDEPVKYRLIPKIDRWLLPGPYTKDFSYDENEIREFVQKKLCSDPSDSRSDEIKLIQEFLKTANPSIARINIEKIADNLARCVPLVEHVSEGSRQNFDLLEWLIARQEVYITKTNSGIKGQPEEEWPARKILAIILGNARENSLEIAQIQDDIAAIGLPIRAWLLDYKERLYNSWGQETYEPIFTQDYLLRLAKTMWELSTRIFGVSLLTYQNLADAFYDADLEKVKKAVRRIAIVTDAKLMNKSCFQSAIWAGEKHWRWNSGGQGFTKDFSGPSCAGFIHFNKVRKAMLELGEPI